MTDSVRTVPNRRDFHVKTRGVLDWTATCVITPVQSSYRTLLWAARSGNIVPSFMIKWEA
jgi:hypothetical protein